MAQQTFSDRLKAAMRSANMKQTDLIHAAEALGFKLGKSQVSQYVSGKTIPRPDVMAVLAQTLNVPTSWLAEDKTHESKPAQTNSATTATTKRNTTEASSAQASGTAATTTEGSAPMRQFKKSSKLDNVLYDVRGPVVDEAARMERQGMRILKLNIGNPAPFGFRTPDEVVQDMRHQLPDCEGYSDSKGLFSARKAIMQYSQIKGLPNVDMDSIYTGNGVSELINLCMQALLDNGDEILIPSPDYPLLDGVRNTRRRQSRALYLRRTGRVVPRYPGHRKQNRTAHQGYRHHQPQQSHGRTVPARSVAGNSRCSSQASTHDFLR